MPLILGTNSIKDTGFNVANSVRLNRGDSANFTRTPSSASNRRTWTWSGWVKRSGLGNIQTLFDGSDGGYPEIFYFDADDKFLYHHDISGSDYKLISSQVFRDVSAWYHIVVAKDTTQSTETNRLKVYVNGSQITMNESALGYPTQNFEGAININDLHIIGNWKGNSYYVDGYLCEVAFIDGSQLDATSFGEFDEDSPTIWKPKDFKDDVTFGTNGFYLDFEDSSALGNDVSGNNNDYTPNNLAATDQSTDTCTNNFATLNPLDIPTANKPNTFSEGNLEITNSADENRTSFSSIGVQSGKWYFEAKFLSGEMKQYIGISKQETVDRIGASANSYGFAGENARKWNNNSYASYGSTASTGDIIMVAFDADNGAIWVGKNGTWFASATQSEIEAGTTTNAMYSSITIDDFFMMGFSMEDSNIQVNFGSPMYAISSGNTDGNGYGNFEYAVPSGYYSLNTKNLAEFG